MNIVRIRDCVVGGSKLCIIAGPCVLENETLVLKVAESMHSLTQKFNMSYIFKGSFDKANRSSIHSYRGPGLEQGLRILESIKNTIGV
ncbi:MAG TPA: 3-deoxy-8-phosphooctulonate synthase, partial [bacterium]|nr:3-deoxy-8-phosphooctulonate synthase [bacterium]